MKCVRDLMERKVVSIGPEQSVEDAIQIMNERKIGAIVIKDREKLSGIFSERDLLKRILGSIAPKGLNATRIRDVMTTGLITARPGQSYLEVLRLMREKGIRHLPVVDRGALVGMVSLRDLMKCYAEELQEEIKIKEATNEELRQAFESLREYQMRLSQAGRLAAIGEIGSGVAHEMMQPLRGIAAHLKTLLEDEAVTSNPALKDKHVKIEDQFVRLKTIVQRISDYSKSRKEDMVPMKVKVPIEDSVYLLKQQMKDHNIELSVELDSESPTIIMDRYQIQDVVMNFLVNARDAVDDLYENKPGGKVMVIVKILEKEHLVAVGVADNGKPVDEGIRDKLFGSFFTTKGPERGTGLGLWLSKNIIFNHRGYVDFIQLSDNAKVFYFVIPFKLEKGFMSVPESIPHVETVLTRIVKKTFD